MENGDYMKYDRNKEAALQMGFKSKGKGDIKGTKAPNKGFML